MIKETMSAAIKTWVSTQNITKIFYTFFVFSKIESFEDLLDLGCMDPYNCAKFGDVTSSQSFFEKPMEKGDKSKLSKFWHSEFQ